MCIKDENIKIANQPDGKDIGMWIGHMNGKYYNSYSGEFKTRGELRPGAKGFDYYTLWDKFKLFIKSK